MVNDPVPPLFRPVAFFPLMDVELGVNRSFGGLHIRGGVNGEIFEMVEAQLAIKAEARTSISFECLILAQTRYMNRHCILRTFVTRDLKYRRTKKSLVFLFSTLYIQTTTSRRTSESASNMIFEINYAETKILYRV